jgi:hypothetical protein
MDTFNTKIDLLEELEEVIKQRKIVAAKEFLNRNKHKSFEDNLKTIAFKDKVTAIRIYRELHPELTLGETFAKITEMISPF